MDMRAMELRSPRMFLPIRPNFLGLLEVEACATGGMGHCPEGHLHSCVHLRGGQNNFSHGECNILIHGEWEIVEDHFD